MTRSVYIAIPLMFLLAVMQTAVLPSFPILNVVPVLPFLFALAWALIHHPEDGLVWAFVGGLFLDLFSLNYAGIHSLAFVVSITAVIFLEATFPEGDYLTMLALSVIGTVIYIVLYGVLLRIWGQVSSFNLILTLLPLILLHAILGLPIYWVLNSFNRLFGEDRVK